MKNEGVAKVAASRNRQKGRQLTGAMTAKEHPAKVLDIINHFLVTVENGVLIITLQDGYVIKVEKTEKFLINAQDREWGIKKQYNRLGVHPLQLQVVEELKDLQYGQLVIRINQGKVEFEKTEKRRVNQLEGAYGDGI
ncbi:MAG: hypothetical protein H6Q75_1759 [Firmicutes bacterium]|nr:hypothetical protein [Bacillota bacterium]